MPAPRKRNHFRQPVEAFDSKLKSATLMPMTILMGNQRHLRVLIVDDEPLVCEAIRMVLATDGHSFEVAHSGPDALEKFAPGRFDVVLVDYNMPGMKGDQLAREICARAASQPVVMLTGSPPVPVPVNVDRLIMKPFDLQELRKALESAAA